MVKFGDVVQTLEDLLKSSGVSLETAKLAVHEKTNVLFVTGDQRVQELVEQLLDALQKNMAVVNARDDSRREAIEMEAVRAASATLPHTACLMSVEYAPASSPPAQTICPGFEDVPRLCAALRAGDQQAFRFLHAQWNQRICRYCFALAAGDDALAMECVQATYLRIYKVIRPLPDEVALWNWIACAARSAAIDLRRVGGRYRRALARFTEWLQSGFGRSPENAQESDLLAALDRAVASLDDDERLLIEARYFRRVSLEEIARETGTTARAIEGRLARLRERLRHTLVTTTRPNEL
jgi:RNA polymerase sigma-70 factor (ECF subfamily)